jgi:hypothetical protein
MRKAAHHGDLYSNGNPVQADSALFQIAYHQNGSL